MVEVSVRFPVPKNVTMHVLIVEDDQKLASVLSRAFEEEGHHADVYRIGDEALRQATRIPYDPIVLDWILPGEDGLRVCRELRRIGNEVPIMMVTARNEVGERVTALDSGACDYVTKPFELDELMARARALARRNAGGKDKIIQAGLVTLDLQKRVARVDGVRIDLTPHQFAFVLLWVRHAGRTVTRSKITGHVWNRHTDPGSNVIDVQVSNIRKKLGSAAWCLETVRGRGLRFAATESA